MKEFLINNNNLTVIINTLKTPKLFPNIKWLRNKIGHGCVLFIYIYIFSLFFILILPVNFLFIIIISPFFLFFSHTSCAIFPTNNPPPRTNSCRRMGNPRVRGLAPCTKLKLKSDNIRFSVKRRHLFPSGAN